jgi:hypothetical protein
VAEGFGPLTSNDRGLARVGRDVPWLANRGDQGLVIPEGDLVPHLELVEALHLGTREDDIRLPILAFERDQPIVMIDGDDLRSGLDDLALTHGFL